MPSGVLLKPRFTVTFTRAVIYLTSYVFVFVFARVLGTGQSNADLGIWSILH